jgi:hypothetical protein
LSWLSQGLSDIGLGGLNTFYNSAIKPVLDNPVADVGLGLGAAALTGGLLAPEIGGLFGATDAAASAAAPAVAGVDAAAAAPTALGFSGDALDPFAGATFAPSADVPTALSSGLTGNVLPGGFASAGGGAPSLTSSVSAAIPNWSVPSLGDIPTDFGQASAFAGAPTNAPPLVPTDTGLGTFEGNINTIANQSFSAPGVTPSSAASNPAWLQTNFPTVSSALSTGKELSPLLGIGGLGYNLYQGYQQKQQLNALQQQEQQQAATAQQTQQQESAAAAPLLSQGNTLISYLTTNTLPPQFATQIQENVAAAKAQIIQGYATRGMSSNPQQNSALAQDLANVDTQATSLQANLESTLATAGTQLTQQASALLQSGISATELSARIPIMVQELNAQLGQQTAQAISSFASAFGGGNSSGQSFKIVSAAA